MLRLAEQAHLSRDYDMLDAIVYLLDAYSLSPRQEMLVLYFKAISWRRHGMIIETEAAMKQLASSGFPNVMSRAMMWLGGYYATLGDLKTAQELHVEGLNLSSRYSSDNFMRLLILKNQSLVASIAGDHKGSLRLLESIRPSVFELMRFYPFFYLDYCNDLAWELSEIGRLKEAHAISGSIVNVSLSKNFPMWEETHREVNRRLWVPPHYKAFISNPVLRSSRTVDNNVISIETRSRLYYDWLPYVYRPQPHVISAAGEFSKGSADPTKEKKRLVVCMAAMDEQKPKLLDELYDTVQVFTSKEEMNQ